jgi:hypothetical protein
MDKEFSISSRMPEIFGLPRSKHHPGEGNIKNENENRRDGVRLKNETDGIKEVRTRGKTEVIR